jgi:hypothetical protein
MTRPQTIRDQADQANEQAIQGGIDGGIRWFLAGVIVFGTAQLVWPPYRKLTPQFKVPPFSSKGHTHFYVLLGMSLTVCVSVVFWFVGEWRWRLIVVTAAGAVINAERR